MVNTKLRLNAGLVEQAHGVIRPFLRPTRLLPTRLGGSRRVFLKLETDQPTGSFKVRGALSNLLRQPENPAGFVTASAGNHGLGVAWAAKESGRIETVTIFIPRSAPQTKVGKFRPFAVDLRIGGETFDDAERLAREFEQETGARYIHAYDDPFTAAGQGTLAIEIREAVSAAEPIGTLVVPVGGGGMVSGSAAWFKERFPATRRVAVQADASPSLSESIRLGRALLEYPAGPTLADGLAGGIGRIVFEHRDLLDEVVNVPEERTRAAIRALYLEDDVRAEASGAITVAALDLEQSRSWPEPIVCVISGSNIDDAVFGPIVA
jgi:threonine dehydratase